MNIGNIVKKRMMLQGMAKNALCESIGTSYTQLNKFLDNRSNISIEALNNCFDQLGINLDMYGRRAELVRDIAKDLIEKDVTENEVLQMKKEEMSQVSNHPEICDLFDLPFENSIQSEEDAVTKLQSLFKSKIIDVESTYLHFKCLVLYAMRVKDGEFSAPNTRVALKDLIETQKSLLQEHNYNSTSKDNSQRKRDREMMDLANSIAPDELIMKEMPVLVKGKKPRQTGAENLFNNSTGKALTLLSVGALALITSSLFMKKNRLFDL